MITQTAKVAANCIRSLLLITPKTPADHSIARYLLPLLITFSTNTAIEDPENARSLTLHALTAFAVSLEGKQRAVAMSIIVPTLLKRANGDEEKVWKETNARLLEMAAADPTAFRAVVGGMTQEQKGFMEGVLVQGRESGRGKTDDGDEGGQEPTIALRMDFGG